MDAALAGKWPVLGRHDRTDEWLGIWAALGRAPRTIDAYARGLAEFLEACERDGTRRRPGCCWRTTCGTAQG
jgi:hypothetical protein